MVRNLRYNCTHPSHILFCFVLDIYAQFYSIDVLWCVSWCLMLSHCVLWCLMMSHDVSWCLMLSYDVSWCLMMSHDVSWCLMMSYDVSWCLMLSHGVLWCLKISLGFFSWFPCFHMVQHALSGLPWCLMGSYDVVSSDVIAWFRNCFMISCVSYHLVTQNGFW